MASGGDSDTGNSIHEQLSVILSELSSLKKEVHDNNVSVSSEVKHLKAEHDIKWKFEGNKQQYSFNTELTDIVKQASWAIQHDKIDYCGEQLKELTDKLHTRNKDIRIADSSPAGWDTVKQYKINPVASDSDDEVKINRAENRALKRKRSSSKGRGMRDTARPVGSGFHQSLPSAQSGMSGRGRNFRPQFAQTLPYGFGPSFAFGHGSGFYGGPAATGPCFHCGENTHFRRDCPRAQSSATVSYAQHASSRK